jgi:hypothetical protein
MGLICQGMVGHPLGILQAAFYQPTGDGRFKAVGGDT